MIGRYSGIKKVWYYDDNGAMRCGEVFREEGLLEIFYNIKGEYTLFQNVYVLTLFPVAMLYASEEECREAGSPIWQQAEYFISEARRMLTDFCKQQGIAELPAWFNGKTIEMAIAMLGRGKPAQGVGDAQLA